MNPSPILQANDLSKTYSSRFGTTHVLSNISLEVYPGESVAISGRSGEGKSTLLHILGTLEKPDSGSVKIEGVIATRHNAPFLRRHSIGFVFQAFHLLEDFSTLENVLMPAYIERKKIERSWGEALLKEVDLLDRAHLPVKLLSGGERQRVAIARALCNNPALILADEPSGNLDAENGKKIGELLLSLAEKQGKGLIVVTHDLQLASLCTRKYTLSNGKLAT